MNLKQKFLVLGGLVYINAIFVASSAYAASAAAGGVIKFDPPEEPYIEYQTETDAQGNKTKTKYNRYYKPLKITYADGATKEYKYLSNYDLVTWAKDERGVITTYGYDAKGNLTKLTEAVGTEDERVTTYLYDAYGQLTEIKYVAAANNIDDVVIRYEYDNYGSLIKETYVKAASDLVSDINITYTIPDTSGRYQTTTDGRGYASLVTYDAVGNLLTDFMPDTATTENIGTAYAYNEAGNLTTVTQHGNSGGGGANDISKVLYADIKTNHSDEITYVTTDVPNSGLYEFQYDRAGRLKALIDQDGNETSVQYDAAGRLTKLVDGQDSEFDLAYTNRLITGITHPTYSETITYDNRVRIGTDTLTAASLLDGTPQAAEDYVQSLAYDKSGNLISETDSNDNATLQAVDSLQRESTKTDAEGNISTLSYDGDNNIIEVLDASGGLTTFTYDLLFNVLTETKNNDSATKRTYTYDNNGNMSSVLTGVGHKTTYSYDEADRLVTEKTYNASDLAIAVTQINHAYDSYGRYAGYSEVNPAVPATVYHSATYVRNTLDQITDVTVDFDGTATTGSGLEKTFSTTYTLNGLKQTYTNEEGHVYTYSYNGNNQLSALTIPGEGQITLDDRRQDAAHQDFTTTFPGNTKHTVLTDDLLRMGRWTLTDPANNTIALGDYAYDGESNVLSHAIQQSGQTTDYQYNYDDIYRLDDWNKSTNPQDASSILLGEDFTYDGNSNRTGFGNSVGALPIVTDTWDYDDVMHPNRLTGITIGGTQEFTFAYDDNGHQIRKTEGTGGSTIITVFVYNEKERLEKVLQRSDNTEPNPDDDWIAKYDYNAYGQRIKKQTTVATTYYLYSDEGLVAEYDAADGSLNKEYHYVPEQTWMTEPIFMRTGGAVYYYQTDHLQTPIRLIDKTGQVVWQAAYDAFGQANLEVSLVTNNLRFPGQYYDSETGLHQNYFRDYDASLGRYIQSDPIGMGGGLNWYAYAAANPLVNIDPTGEIAPLVFRAGLFAVCMAGCVGGSGGPPGFDCPGPNLGPFEAAAVGYCAYRCAKNPFFDMFKPKPWKKPNWKRSNKKKKSNKKRRGY